MNPPRTVDKPTLTIDLRGPDGNVYAVISQVKRALRGNGQGVRAEEWARLAVEQKSYEAVLEFAKEYAHITYIR